MVATGVDTAGTINGVAAAGSGQYLTGATGDASQGLKIQISGGTTGARGTVNYSQGYAYQFNTLANSMLGSDGVISSSTDGINASIKRLNVDQQAMSARLTVIEARYRAQFTALDTMISSMNTTSSFLTQQLANLPKNTHKGEPDMFGTARNNANTYATVGMETGVVAANPHKLIVMLFDGAKSCHRQRHATDEEWRNRSQGTGHFPGHRDY